MPCASTERCDVVPVSVSKHSYSLFAVRRKTRWSGFNRSFSRSNLATSTSALSPTLSLRRRISKVKVAGVEPKAISLAHSADTKGMPLTPVAVIEGKVAASNMLMDQKIVPDYTGIPTAVFTVPELARVGMLEAEAREAGHDVDVRFTDTGGWYSKYRIGEASAAAKVLVDKSDGKIVGAHLFGPEYGELINFFGLAMKLELTAKQLKSMTAVYPSVGSDLGSFL